MTHTASRFFFLKTIIVSVLGVLLASCSVTKYVPDDQYLLDNVNIVSHVPNMGTAELETYLTQHPNFRVFGMSRLRLHVYNMSGRDTTKRRNRWLRKMGDAPVLYESFQTIRSRKKLEQHFRSKGYLNATVKDSVAFKDKKATVFYLVDEKEPYRLRKINYDYHNDTVLGNLVSRNRFLTTKLKTGDLFDVDVLNAERDRIANIARRNGYYYFTKEYVSYIADSSLRSHQVDLTLLLKPFLEDQGDGNLQETTHPRYTVGCVNVLTLPRSSSSAKTLASYDSTDIGENVKLFFEKRPLIRKKLIKNSLRVVPGMWYNSGFVNHTYTRLSSFGIVRSAEISFKDLKTDDHQLECNVVMASNKQHSFSLDLEGTNSSGDFGMCAVGLLQHRNLLHGSELLSLKGRYSFESLTPHIADYDIKKTMVYDRDLALSLKLPQFVLPFLSTNFRRRVNATTELTLAYDYQIQPDYHRRILTAGGKYNWTARRYYSYTIDAFNINLVDMLKVDKSFHDRYKKYPVLLESYKDHLIVGSGFSFVYDNQNSRMRLHKTSYKFSVESAGNLLRLLAKPLRLETVTDSSFANPYDKYVVAGVPFSQFVKGEFDYSYNRYIDEKNRLVFHSRLGISVPYLNDKMVPFEERFFGGGASGVRGWSVRTLGPGSYTPKNYRNDYVGQTGNVELTFNVEYRSKLFWIMEGAAFVDAGNIWNIRDYDYAPEGTFKIDRFYKQIALAYGLGLRFDFTYFLCRLDLGMKAYDPAPDNGLTNWRYKNITWSDDFAFHFAIGYPF